jgi:hypothetical protein
MDEILVAIFMVFQQVVEEGCYDLVIGDEAWDVDYYWHENPELKLGQNCMATSIACTSICACATWPLCKVA